MKTRMTTKHPKWSEFWARVEMGLGKQGCDNGFAIAQEALEEMNTAGEDVDILASLDYYGVHGGHCTCEILFNVEHSVEYDYASFVDSTVARLEYVKVEG